MMENMKDIEEKAKGYAIDLTCKNCIEFIENGSNCPEKTPCNEHKRLKDKYMSGQYQKKIDNSIDDMIKKEAKLCVKNTPDTCSNFVEYGFNKGAEFGYNLSLNNNHNLTKRELFAAIAMNGLINAQYYTLGNGELKALSERSVYLADALIEELDKDKKQENKLNVYRVDHAGVIFHVIANSHLEVAIPIVKEGYSKIRVEDVKLLTEDEIKSCIIHDDKTGRDISLRELIDREKYTEPTIIACSEW